MRKRLNSFTIIDLVVVMVVGGLVSGLLSGPLMASRQKGKLIMCVNNVKQIGIGVVRFEMEHDVAPAYSPASATTTTDGNLCAANLLRLYSSGVIDELATFRCPYGAFAPAPADAAASVATVKNDPDGAKYTSYNLTTCYSSGDPANKIIVADMPWSKDDVNASAHDLHANAIDVGPNCLYKDGHVSNVKKLCPEGSSEYDLSRDGSIYRVDGGAGKGKDTCILGVDR